MIYYIKKQLRDISHRNKVMRDLYILANRIKIWSLSRISDERYAKLKFLENTGQILDLDDPITFNEKLWWLKLNNRDPLLTVCSDKLTVRDYVNKCGLAHMLIKLHGVYNNANEIDFKTLPSKVFIKTNHGSGLNIIYDKDKSFNEESFRKKFNSALKNNYYLQSREWNYKNINPKILVEEILEDKSSASLKDYRFLCFDGKVKMIFVDINTVSPDGSHNAYAQRNVYDRNFNYLDIKVGREQFDRHLFAKPINYHKMIEYAEILAKPFPHCRVDFYNIKGKIYFGEITFYHGGGCQSITPNDWDKTMGDWIDLKSEKIVLK